MTLSLAQSWTTCLPPTVRKSPRAMLLLTQLACVAEELSDEDEDEVEACDVLAGAHRETDRE